MRQNKTNQETNRNKLVLKKEEGNVTVNEKRNGQ